MAYFIFSLRVSSTSRTIPRWGRGRARARLSRAPNCPAQWRWRASSTALFFLFKQKKLQNRVKGGSFNPSPQFNSLIVFFYYYFFLIFNPISHPVLHFLSFFLVNLKCFSSSLKGKNRVRLICLRMCENGNLV